VTTKIEQHTQLKAGFTAEDPRLGRIPQFDPRNRAFDVSRRLTAPQIAALRGRTWYMPPALVKKKLNQNGSQCTGESAIYDLMLSPVPLKRPDGQLFTDEDGYAVYDEARRQDEWPGEDYEGSSVLGAAKALVVLGYIGEYSWAFDIDTYLAAVSHIGPVVNGTEWTNTMFEPHPSGLIIPSDARDVAGGHAYVTRSIYVNEDYKRYILGKGEPNRKGVPLLRGPNSWGNDWARDGDWLMWSDDMERLQRGLGRWPGDARITSIAFHR
jgi:hypothetical protein